MTRFAFWATRVGFYLAVFGTASGLGNLWRFPYIVAENGGGAFVLLYILLVFVVGMPLLIGELMLGKLSRKSIIVSIEEFSKNPPREVPRYIKKMTPYIGFTALIVCLMILGYFSVISGWVLLYLIKFSNALFFANQFDPNDTLDFLVGNGWIQLGFAAVHLLMVSFVVSKDIEGGIERFVGYIMPAFGFLLCVLVWKSLSLETTEEALRFLFYPNFSSLNLSSLGHALGHVLFTLSIGFTTMVTFGSVLPRRSKTPIAGFRIATVDSLTSLLAGMLIFPLLISFSQVKAGPLLLFETVPVFLNKLEGGELFGFGFFICLYLGSFAASLSLLDTVVANFKEKDKMPRTKSAWLAGGLCLLMTFVPSMSSSLLKGFKIHGRYMLEVLDSSLIDWALPLVALMVSQFVYYHIPDSKVQDEFAEPDGPRQTHIYKQWRFALKWVIPLITITALTLQIISLF